MIKEELTELLENYYNGSFAELACDYICRTEMTQQEVERMLEEIRRGKSLRAYGNSLPFVGENICRGRILPLFLHQRKSITLKQKKI